MMQSNINFLGQLHILPFLVSWHARRLLMGFCWGQFRKHLSVGTKGLQRSCNYARWWKPVGLKRSSNFVHTEALYEQSLPLSFPGLLFASPILALYRGSDCGAAYSCGQKDKREVTNYMHSTEASSVLACMGACLDNLLCTAINWRGSDKRCELCSDTNIPTMIPEAGFSHYSTGVCEVGTSDLKLLIRKKKPQLLVKCQIKVLYGSVPLKLFSYSTCLFHAGNCYGLLER